MALFQAAYVNKHWLVMKDWNFFSIKQRCVRARDDGEEEALDEHHDDDLGGDDNDRGDDTRQTGGTTLANKSDPHKLLTASSTTYLGRTVKSSQRYTYAKKLFDEVAAHFASKDMFTSFVDVLRAVIITCKSGDPDAGFARIKSYITVDPRFQKPKIKEPTLLPAVIVKEGRTKKNSRGKMSREMRTTAPQCSFCLSRNPVHRVGSKCKPLMAKGMNVELNPTTFPLILTRPSAATTNLVHYDGQCKPQFVHVLNKADVAEDVGTLVEDAYICTLYVHAAEIIGTYLVHTTIISEWTVQTTCRVFISGTHELPKLDTLSNPRPQKRKHSVESTSQVTRTSCSSVSHINGHVKRLHRIWEKREGGLEETWEESRIGRITGTSAKIVMTGKNKPSGLQLAQIFGLSTFQATTQMQIGTILETKILQAFCKQQKMQLKKERGGSSLSLLYQYSYVGHTPDGKTKKLKDDEGEVLEVKVVFSTKDALSTIFKKHRDQLHLGLFVHRCKSGRLLVYRCNLEMTLQEAERHEVNVYEIEERRFEQDKLWFAKFKPYVEAFYTDHLEWFYARMFDTEQARMKVESILSEVKKKRDIVTHLKKQKLLLNT
jgi:hypothetical protein